MSNRALSSPMQTAIGGASVTPILFYEGEFVGGTLRMWTGQGTLTMSGEQWTGAGQLLSIATVGETLDVRAEGISVSLSGMPSSLISTVLGSAEYGRPGKLWLAVLRQQRYLKIPGSGSNSMTSPDSAALDIAGDIDIEAVLALDSYASGSSQRIISHDGSAGDRGWIFYVAATGELGFQSTQDGSTFNISTVSTVTIASLGINAGDSVGLRVKRTSASGAIDYEYSTDNGATWSALGASTSDDTGALWDTSGQLKTDIAAGGALAGKIFLIKIRDGIDGPLAASFNANDGAPGDVSITSSDTGEVWTINQSGATPAELLSMEQILPVPYLVFSGKLDQPQIDDSGNECTITVQYESNLADLQRPRVRHYTPEDQALDYPSDQGFEFVASLQDKSVVWGPNTQAPAQVQQPRNRNNVPYSGQNPY